MEVLFSFGTSEQFPFQGGYIIINASNKIAAVCHLNSLFVCGLSIIFCVLKELSFDWKMTSIIVTKCE